MTFNPKNYITAQSCWEQLRDYVLEQKAVPLTQSPDKTVKKFFLVKSEKTLATPNECEAFNRALRDRINNKHFALDKSNTIRLLYILSIHSTEEIQDFCRNVLHQNELSAHCLEDFIALYALKANLPYQEYLEISNRYRCEKPASDVIGFDVTKYLINDANKYIIDKKTLEEFIYLHFGDFAKARNTPYLFMFDHINWEIWTREEWNAFFKYYPNLAPAGYEAFSNDDWIHFTQDGITNELEQKLIIYCSLDSVPYPNQEQLANKRSQMNKFHPITSSEERVILKNYYLQLFSLCENGLSDEQIQVLSTSSSFSDTFLTYDKYRNLYSRTLTTEIPQGAFLLSFLFKYDPDYGDYRFGDSYEYDDNLRDFACNLFDPNNDIKRQFDFINKLMATAGFPALCDNIPFNRLFMETYIDVLSSTSETEFEEVHNSFMNELCSRLKQIADLLVQNQTK